MFANIQLGRVISLSDTQSTSPRMQSIDVSSITPQPQVGWTYDGTNFAIPVLDPVVYAGLKIKAGNDILFQTQAMISAQNTALNLTVAQIAAIMTSFSQLQSLLQVGALATSLQLIQSMAPNYSDYTDAFNYAQNAINQFQAVYGTIQ